MTGRTYVQGCGYHETAYGPPDVVAEFLEARGFQVEVIELGKVDTDANCASHALVLVRKRRSEH